MPPSYEETALAGRLSDEQIDLLIAAFVKNSDVIAIAHDLDIPRELVIAALEDGSIAERALAAKRSSAAVRFMGAAIDQLQAVLETPMSMTTGAEKVAAIKLMRDLLGLRPAERLDRPAKKTAGKAPAETKPKGGALEAALDGDDDDEDV